MDGGLASLDWLAVPGPAPFDLPSGWANAPTLGASPGGDGVGPSARPTAFGAADHRCGGEYAPALGQVRFCVLREMEVTRAGMNGLVSPALDAHRSDRTG